MEDPVKIAIQKLKNHPGITSIKENIVSLENFKFDKVSLDNILKNLNNLDRTKNRTFGEIPSKRLKLISNEIALHVLHI